MISLSRQMHAGTAMHHGPVCGYSSKMKPKQENAEKVLLIEILERVNQEIVGTFQRER